jgi:hypothetical protein
MYDDEDLEEDDLDEDEYREKTPEELSQLEEEFKAALKIAKDKINAKLAEAMDALVEAENISEEYGIPFHSNISPLSQTYTPASYKKKFGDIPDIVDELSNWDNAPGEYEGWEHSAVC